ncbi:MAG TPA: hypothetical protein VFA90_01155 [Terriglobales bacterium]|nr:hypothetical protein [Terriglobales bacterium]
MARYIDRRNKTLDYANTGNFVVVPGWASDISTSGDPTAGNETVYVVGSTQNGANVYRYSSSNGELNGSWTELNGVLNKIATAGYWQTLGVQTGASSVYHLNSIKLSLTAKTTGYYDCNVFPNGCPQGSTHTATVNATWKSKGVGSNGSPSTGPPASTLNSIAYPYSDDCDPIFGDPSSPECQIEVAGAVQCSVMGTLFSFSFPTLKIHFGYDFNWYDAPQAASPILNLCSWALADASQCDSVSRTDIDPIQYQCFPQKGAKLTYQSVEDIVPWVEWQIGTSVNGAGLNNSVLEKKVGFYTPAQACRAVPAHWGQW